MNKRLLCIADNINGNRGFVDVGTDHGYLPVHMAIHGYVGNIFASDINSEPLNCAIRSADEAGVSDKINFLLCDGLNGDVKDKVDTIVIAGMGGDTICGILDSAEWCMNDSFTFILQPMTKAEVLRYWLSFNDFNITKELLVEDCGTIYQIICARYGKRNTLSDAELFVGKTSLAVKNKLYERHLKLNIKRLDKMLQGLELSKDRQDLVRRAFYHQVHAQLCELGRAYLMEETK